MCRIHRKKNFLCCSSRTKMDKKWNLKRRPECYPQKNKKWLPQKCWRTLLRGGLLLHSGKMAYFIAYGFINAIQTLSACACGGHGQLGSARGLM